MGHAGNRSRMVGKNEQTIVSQGGKTVDDGADHQLVEGLDRPDLVFEAAGVCRLVRRLDVQVDEIAALKGAKGVFGLAAVVGVEIAGGAGDLDDAAAYCTAVDRQAERRRRGVRRPKHGG